MATNLYLIQWQRDPGLIVMKSYMASDSLDRHYHQIDFCRKGV